MIPARLSTANSCSRNCTGTSRLRASSPIGTGSGPELRPSSASASTAYGDLLEIEIIALGGSCTAGRSDRSDLQPAALGRDQHGLRTIDGAELAVDVVQVRAHGARRERQLVGDLLVDLALGEPLQDAELATRQRTRVDVTAALVGRAGQLIQHSPQLLGAQPHGAGGLEHLTRGDDRPLLVMGKHVGQADEGGLALDLGVVVALDR